MLKQLWESATRYYQSQKQEADKDRVKELDEHIDEARHGYVNSTYKSPRGWQMTNRIELTKDEAKALVQRMSERRNKLLETMREREIKYAL